MIIFFDNLNIIVENLSLMSVAARYMNISTPISNS